MKGMKFFARIVLVGLVLIASITASRAQGPGKPMAPARDPELEISAKHNLDVARWYIEKRKAFAGARDRLQEIIDTYPDFSRMDEVFFLMGEANFKLADEDKARDYYEKLLKIYPDSEFAKKTRARLDELKPK